MSYLLNTTGYPQYLDEIIHAEGCYVIDKSGKRYLDLEAGVWSLPLGHNHPKIIDTMQKQLHLISHVGYKYSALVVEEAAKKLLHIAGFDYGKCVFLTSGSEAVEFALQLVRKVKPGKKGLCLKHQYFSAYGYGSELSHSDWIQLEWTESDDRTVKEWERYLCDVINFSDIGFFLFEAGNSSGIVKLPPQNLVTAINQKMDEIDAYIVVDEVTAGIGRTGQWFGYQNYQLEPDLVAVGKGLGNGYPVSAVIMTEELGKMATTDGFHYAQSHQNDPMGAAIALTVLEVIENDNLLVHGRKMGEYLRTWYHQLQKVTGCISEIRGIGMMNCIQLKDSYKEEDMIVLDQRLCQAGFLVAVKPTQRVIRTYAPLILNEKMIDAYCIELKSLLI